MLRPFTKLLSRLSVGRKLLLIYLLDLSAVIFISGILIHEKYIAIDFARKERAGNEYIMALREPLLAAADGRAAAPDAMARAVREAEDRFGAGMDSATLADTFAMALARPTDDAAPLAAGRALVTRVGNKSNLILDPDLDSYYTMSLVLLRYPELVDVAREITAAMQATVATGAPMTTEMQTRYFILEGRLDAVSKSIASDFGEAFSGSADGRLKAALDPQRAALMTGIEAFRKAARAMLSAGAGDAQLADVVAMDAALLRRLDTVWLASSVALNRLIDERIDGFFERMWLHLGTALFLLCLILVAVFTVARHIAVPLRRLAKVAEDVARYGDEGGRVAWKSGDEIGKLVTRFNDMLDRMERVRSSEKELAARERAAVAQRELVEALPIPMMVTAIPTHEVLHANGPAQAWLNGRTEDPWGIGLDPATRSRFFQRLADEDVVGEYEVRWGGGDAPTWAVLSARRLNYQGRDAIVTAFTPINRMKLLEQRLGLWAKVFEASSESIMIVDADHRILSVNRAFQRTTLHDARDVLDETPAFLFDLACGGSDRLCWSTAEARGAWQGEVRIKRRDDSVFPAWMVISAVRDPSGALTHFVCASLDISERKANEERIRWLAHHDALTGLPNRSLCIERLREAMTAAQASGEKVAVLFIDLDHFKTINDSLGHHVGDGLLRSVAQRLVDGVRSGDTVSRLGGDEFVVVLRDVGSSAEVLETVEQRLVPAIRRPHVVGASELQVSCSVGVALYPDDAGDLDELMRHADVAMYEAKHNGRDSAQRFTSALDERAQRKLRVQSLMRTAVDRAEFSLHYQPKVRASNRALVGVEALLRWNSPELVDVHPAEFIPIAEESRLIVPIGAWVVEEALRQHARWKADGLGEIPVSINVSAVQLRKQELVDTFRDALRRHAITPAMIELELTEHVLMDDTALDVLQDLKLLGVMVSVDDFGTGYSSLTTLSRFPVDRIKIDRRFVHDLLDDPADFAIARAIIGLGHTLGLASTAEGVESEAVALMLRDAHCTELQGHHIAPPMRASDFVAWHLARRENEAGRRLRLVEA